MDASWASLGLRFTEPVRDPLWKNILLPAEFMPVVESPQFVQLSRIMQLGPAQLVYPGATHTRRAHSLGVFEMARRILGALLERGASGIVTPAGSRAFLMAALCHDLGHFPYAHSLKELPLAEHEALTARRLAGPLAGALSAAGIDPGLAAAIVDQDLPGDGAELGFYRALLSGVLDPDKLDYLNRDAWACGVPYGLQDVDFVLQHVGLEDGRPGISAAGSMAVEGVLFSKYRMYRAVYWHKTVRSATAMIKKAVSAALASGSLVPDMLYGLDDAGFYALMAGPERDPDSLVSSVAAGRLLKPCLELPWDGANPACLRAADLSLRPALEAELSIALGEPGRPALVVVDLPEPISFESDLPVLGTGSGFSALATVFRPETVAAFSRALRVLRVYSDRDPARAHAAAAEAYGLPTGSA